MSDWSTNAARRLSEKKKAEAARNVRQNHEQELIGLGSRELWDSLRTALNEEILAFNAEPGIETGFLSCNNSDPMVMKVSRKDSQKSAVITFDPERHFATVKWPGISSTHQTFTVLVSDGDRLRFFNEETALTNTHIVQEVLDGLLKS